MWSSKDITIEKKKMPCMVNESDNMIEIEMPFDLKLRKATSVTIDSTDYKITSMEDVGERKETLKITIEVKNNDKSIKGRKDSKLSE